MITNVEHTFNVFFWDLTSVFLIVAVKTPAAFCDNCFRVTDFLSALNTRFSSLRVSIPPLPLKEILYLSSSNVSKNSLVEVNVIVAVPPLEVKVNLCLVVISDELKSRLDIAISGMSDTKVEFLPSIIWGLTILKSLVVIVPDGNSFWQTPVISIANATRVSCDPVPLIALTLLNVGSVSLCFWYFTISFTLIPLANLFPAAVTVPPEVIVNSVPAGAGLPSLESNVSALNVTPPVDW